MSGELSKKLEEQRSKMQQKTARTQAKLNALKNIINDDLTLDNDENVENGAVRVNSDPDLTQLESRGRQSLRPTRSDPRLSIGTPRRTPAVANLRHRRSRSTDADTWLDHQPRAAPLNTILQPAIRHRRSVTNIEEKDLINDKTSKYVLTHQDTDQQGEIETRLYKVRDNAGNWFLITCRV